MNPGAMRRLPSTIASSPAICRRGSAIAAAGRVKRTLTAFEPQGSRESLMRSQSFAQHARSRCLSGHLHGIR